MKWSNKRPIPNNEVLSHRRELSKRMSNLQTKPKYIQNGQIIKGLEEGNKKTGTSGKNFDIIKVFNLPAITSCPGASNWCKEHCFNFDDRQEVYSADEWQSNLYWSINNINELKKRISQQLESLNSNKVAVRFHSSGDFYSFEYIQMWKEICIDFPQTRFWGYTRSWAVGGLYDQIKSLASFDNVNLFASWDASMQPVPDGWRKSIVVTTNEEVDVMQKNKSFYICPEQYGLVRCCADCSFCIYPSDRNVIFILH